MNDRHIAFLDGALAGLPSADAGWAKEAILRSFPTAGDEARYIDKDLTSSDSYVFLWGDLLSLSAAIEAIKQQADGKGASENDVPTKLLRGLVALWIKMRAIRVEISDVEAKVLRTVGAKNHNIKVEDMAKATGLGDADVRLAVASLKQKMYQEKTPLLSADTEGNLSTPF